MHKKEYQRWCNDQGGEIEGEEVAVRQKCVVKRSQEHYKIVSSKKY